MEELLLKPAKNHDKAILSTATPDFWRDEAGSAGIPARVPVRRGQECPRSRKKSKTSILASALAPPPPGPACFFCDFPASRRVLRMNNDPPVPASSAGPMNPADDFATFMRNHQNMVFTTAVRIVANDAQAEDIAQDVFLKAYERYGDLRGSPSAGGWLKTVATNLSINHLQRYRKRWRFFSEFTRDRDDPESSSAPAVEWAAPDTFHAGLDQAERRARLEQALARLPDHQRIPLVLFHFEDMPYDEIARTLRVSLSKIKTDILRARAALAKLLAPADFN